MAVFYHEGPLRFAQKTRFLLPLLCKPDADFPTFEFNSVSKIPVKSCTFNIQILTPKFIIEASLKEVYGDPDRMTPETVTRYYELLRREGNRQAYINRRQPQSRQSDDLPELPAPVSINDIVIPVLILWGRLDSWIPVRTGYRLHDAITHSELIIYDDLSHVPMEEDPVRTISDVREFLMRMD